MKVRKSCNESEEGKQLHSIEMIQVLTMQESPLGGIGNACKGGKGADH